MDHGYVDYNAEMSCSVDIPDHCHHIGDGLVMMAPGQQKVAHHIHEIRGDGGVTQIEFYVPDHRHE